MFSANLLMASAPAPAGYNYYLINITANNGSTLMTQINELIFYDNTGTPIHPPLTSNTAPSPYIASASSSYNGTAQIFKGIDGSSLTWWGTVGLTGWFKLYVGPTPKSLGSVYIESNIAANRAPKDFTIQGSTDDITYTTLKTVAGNASQYLTVTVP